MPEHDFEKTGWFDASDAVSANPWELSLLHYARNLRLAVATAPALSLHALTAPRPALPQTQTEVGLDEIETFPAFRYDSLKCAVQSMAALDDDESLKIDSSSLNAGLYFIHLLQAFGIAPPKVFSHGGDALVFAWDRAATNRYVTTSGNDAYVEEFKKGGQGLACVDEYKLNMTPDVYKLAHLLGGTIWKQIKVATPTESSELTSDLSSTPSILNLAATP